MNKQWTTQQSYERKVGYNYADLKKDPEKYGYTEEQVVSKTTPGQAISVKDLMERYEKGRPIPEE